MMKNTLHPPSKKGLHWRSAATALALALAHLYPLPASAQQTLVNDTLDALDGTRLEVISVFQPMPPSGYAPLRIVATNGSSHDDTWRLDFDQKTQEYRNENRQSAGVSMAVPARSTQTVQFLLPMVLPYGSSSSGYYNGREMTILYKGRGSREFPHHSNFAKDFPAIAISKELTDASLASLKDELEQRMKSSSRYSGSDLDFGSEFDPKEAPEDWLGYSGFDYLLITDAEWAHVKPGARHAILQWVRLGGQLHFYHQEAKKAADLPADDPQHSLGKIASFTWNGTRLPAEGTVGRYWGGTSRLEGPLEDHIPHWDLMTSLGTRSFNSWQVVVFLALFGILVGPVNLFVLAPSGRRHRLFITTPLLSLGASILMVGIILVQDGIGGIGARFVFVDLQPAEASAYVTQKQVSRTGVLLGSTFEVRQPAQIEPLTLSDSDWVKLKKSHDAQPVNLTQQGAQRSGNYFQSRTEQAQMIRTAVSTRARLEVTPAPSPGTPPTVVSALGFTVDQMFYADHEGHWWTLKTPLATGQKADLIPASGEKMNSWWSVEKLPSQMDALTDLAQAPRNRFFASATAAPDFTVDTLSAIRWQQDRILIHGSVTPP